MRRVPVSRDKINFYKVSKYANALIFKELYPYTKTCRITLNMFCVYMK